VQSTGCRAGVLNHCELGLLKVDKMGRIGKADGRICERINHGCMKDEVLAFFISLNK
jgi:hypothetical protein